MLLDALFLSRHFPFTEQNVEHPSPLELDIMTLRRQSLTFQRIVVPSLLKICLLGLLDPEDEGTMIFENNGNYLLNNII